MCGTAEVGTPVKADASFSVSRALQLQLPKQLAILEEVSEYASREYSLERALDKMQVRVTAFPETTSNIQQSSCLLSLFPSSFTHTALFFLFLSFSLSSSSGSLKYPWQVSVYAGQADTHCLSQGPDWDPPSPSLRLLRWPSLYKASPPIIWCTPLLSTLVKHVLQVTDGAIQGRSVTSVTDQTHHLHHSVQPAPANLLQLLPAGRLDWGVL